MANQTIVNAMTRTKYILDEYKSKNVVCSVSGGQTVT